ncbi:MAG: hypothetical protein H6739_15935 [Alphaproteobacteria bacterium]|nr:hypothetical protein [Alphaproteobacteria bacterium]
MIALALLAGCVSLGGLGTARTMDAGETDVYAGSEWGWVDSRPFATPLLRSDLGARHGLSDRVEVGGNVGFFPVYLRTVHTSAYGKLAVLRPEDPRGGLNLSVAFSGAWDMAESGGILGQSLTAQVPLMIGVQRREHLGWELSPRVAAIHLRSKGAAPITKLMVGTGVGVAIRWTHWTLLPQLGVMWSTNPADQTGGMWVWQGAMGVYF